MILKVFPKLFYATSLLLWASTSLWAQQPAASHPGNAAKAKLKPPHHPDRVIVKFKEGVDVGKQEEAHSRAETRLHKRLKKLRRIEVRALLGKKAVAEAIAAYEASGVVEFAEPDYVVKADPAPNDPLFARGELWYANNAGQSGGKPDADLDAPEGWDTRTISNAVVAVIDTGIRYTHEDLKANMWRNPGEIPGNQLDDDGNGYVDDVYGINAITGSGDPADDNGHGTHVAGTIGAVGNNGKGIAGIAWAVRIMACKFMDQNGSGYTSDAIECIDYARSKGAVILNNSWGGGGYSNALYDALERCRTQGAIVVAAAGNESSNNDTNPSYPAGYALDNLMAVAATTRKDTLAGFSNYGPNTVEIAAPGDEIVSTYSTSDTSYAELSGTSMAAPQVSGLLALLRSHFPTDNHRQLLSRAMQTAEPLPTLAGVTRTGRRINLQKALTTLATPSNDAFAGAALAAGDSFIVRTATKDATKEAGEPAYADNSGGASVWWKWTPAASGPVTASTAGSGFDTLLAVYTGNSVATLVPVASNDNAPNVATSAVAFTATANQTYYFAVDGQNGAWGSAVLTVKGPPSGEINNAFGKRLKVKGRQFTTSGANRNANKEANEPLHGGNPGGKSVWWTWTAPVQGYFTIQTRSSSFDTVLGVYTGATLERLKQVAANDDANADTTHSKVRFFAIAGRTYHIAVDGADGASGDIQIGGVYR